MNAARRIDLEARVALSLAIEPGDRRLHALLQEHSAAELAEDPGSWMFPGEVSRMNLDAARRALDEAHHHSPIPVLPGDKLWPASLDEVPSMDPLGPAAPLMLWARGDAGLLSSRSLAIAGARASTGYGTQVTTELAGDIARDGTAVLSGAAYGIDAAAHRAALGEGAPTVAVPANGLDRAYPAAHRDLLDRIAEQGAVVSEMPSGTVPTRHRFIMRSRIMAALTAAVLIPEAGARSGALRLAEMVHALGKPAGAVPGPVTSAASAGCHLLIRQSAAQLVTSSDDVLGMLAQ